MSTAMDLMSKPTTTIATRSTREADLQNRLVDLCGQAVRCVVDSDDSAERATTLGVAIRTQTKALDEDRKTLVGPLNGVVKDINARYARLVEPAGPAMEHLTGSRGQLTMWNIRKRREAEEAAARARAEAERVRLEEAQRAAEEAARLKAEGDAEAAAIAQQQADNALEAAVSVPEEIKAPTTVTRGIYGGSSGTAEIGKFAVDDMAALLAWELANVKAGRGVQYVLVNEVELGKIARGKGDKPVIPGVRWYREESSRLRG